MNKNCKDYISKTYRDLAAISGFTILAFMLPWLGKAITLNVMPILPLNDHIVTASAAAEIYYIKESLTSLGMVLTTLILLVFAKNTQQGENLINKALNSIMRILGTADNGEGQNNSQTEVSKGLEGLLNKIYDSTVSSTLFFGKFVFPIVLMIAVLLILQNNIFIDFILLEEGQKITSTEIHELNNTIKYASIANVLFFSFWCGIFFRDFCKMTKEAQAPKLI
ncbi:hypothetical protein [Pseudoalteromonas sp. MEBiC 03485]|uniref:hypothetical protein n=1 Tax=Pseudoalteromonas sp. MEBiC 03485 TaxID=2571103 RepID=UPI001020CAA0|nr:hypothetical protein [Pseudoalteromonas sp. MEBiC 03485]RZD19693.1 hypothetical protein EVU92_21055 [Pseudoalteromonas sp. MEBiC 03485]